MTALRLLAAGFTSIGYLGVDQVSSHGPDLAGIRRAAW